LDKTIIRVHKEPGHYFLMHKHPINDAFLSLKAKGLLGYCLSKPDDWTFYIQDISNHATDGVDSIRAGFDELKKYNYCKMFRNQNPKGQFDGWTYHIYEVPTTETGLSDFGKTDFGKSNTTNNKDTKNKDTNNEKTPLTFFTNVYGGFTAKQITAGYGSMLNNALSDVGAKEFVKMVQWTAGKKMSRTAAAKSIATAAENWNKPPSEEWKGKYDDLSDE